MVIFEPVQHIGIEPQCHGLLDGAIEFSPLKSGEVTDFRDI